MRETWRVPVLAFTLLCLCWGCSSCKSESAAPLGDWPTAAPEEQGFDSAELAEIIEQIKKLNLPIDSLQLVRNGVLVLDAYFYPYLGDRTHDLASVTKSVTSTLVGISVDQGRLALDQGMIESFPELVPVPPADERAEITVRDLITMTSGLDCGRTPGEPELNEMRGTDHYARYALNLPLAVTPGTEFAYCSPGSHLMSAMVAKASEASPLEFAKENLFDPLGITEVAWPMDPQGVNHGWGDLQLHPRDMARIGLLFLNQGSWNGVQVVSKAWVDEATRSHVIADPDGTGYGYQWWVLAGAFEGVYEARGRSGQAIIVWPDKDIVAVFTGRGLDVRGEIAPVLVAAMKSDSPIAPNPDAYARLNRAIENATTPPQAKPVPALPPMAEEVSGKIYQLADNQFGVSCISLRFDSASEVWFDLTLGDGAFALPVGMDGVPRFSETGPTDIPVGLLGEWTESNEFSMQYDEVGGSNHLRIRGDFGDDAGTVDLEFADPGEYFPPQTVPGSSVPSCD
ncbi:MAG: serine hydrolase domain-containing protein [Polyangiales bacterium]